MFFFVFITTVPMMMMSFICSCRNKKYPDDIYLLGTYYKACVFITTVPIIKLFAWGKGDSGGHVLLRKTTSRGLC
jgi:hypothetical protein